MIERHSKTGRSQPQQTVPEEVEQPRNALEALLNELDMSPEQAAQILMQVMERSTQQRRRAEQVLEAIDLIGDPNFTLETLRATPEAMQALEQGENIGDIYRHYFLRREPQPVEGEANLGGAQGIGARLSRQDIERISDYVDRTGKVYSI